MNFYICIFISFIFTVLILRYFFNSSQEGLTNKKGKGTGRTKRRSTAERRPRRKSKGDIYFKFKY